jgi:hypothetical protein
MPGRFIAAIALCGSILLLIIGDASAASKTVNKPMFNGNRLDWCLKWSHDCGKAAADAYCVAQGFQAAVDFKPDRHIGDETPTRLIGSGAICDLAHCDGFRQITCEKIPLVRPASATARKPLALQRVSLLQPVSLIAPLPPAKPATIVRQAKAAPAASPGTPPPAAKAEQTETDPTKTESEIGWKATESVESGLEKTVRWYLANEAWWQPLREKRYAGERLGLLAR